ncbi:MAG: hypothetical protein MZV63_31345 [Marinilabiliales bacterium]|nr:hypothetical protein [Marinilabiliales bacterium]
MTAQCAANAGDVMYLKDFVVKLDQGTPGGAPPTARFALLLSKSVVYRFSICTAPNSDGEAVLQLFDMNTLLGSTFITATGKDYPFFRFQMPENRRLSCVHLLQGGKGWGRCRYHVVCEKALRLKGLLWIVSRKAGMLQMAGLLYLSFAKSSSRITTSKEQFIDPVTPAFDKIITEQISQRDGGKINHAKS